MSASTTDAIDQSHFRKTLGHFPTGVVIVAADTAAGRVGLTLQSFMSLSLDPALILLSVAKTSTSWPRIAARGTFAVSILAEHQSMIARQFARNGVDKFAGVTTVAGRVYGNPVIAGSIAWLECELHSVHSGGDHDIVVAQVRDLDVTAETQGEAQKPLVFCQASFPHLETRSS